MGKKETLDKKSSARIKGIHNLRNARTALGKHSPARRIPHLTGPGWKQRGAIKAQGLGDSFTSSPGGLKPSKGQEMAGVE